MKVKKQITLFFIFILLILSACFGEKEPMNQEPENRIPPTIRGQEAIDSPYIQVGGSIKKVPVSL
jgi:hypothetical protein